MPAKVKKATGRPPKFQEARRPITVTLPDRTLGKLALIDKDKARAIVKAADAVILEDDDSRAAVEIVPVGPDQGLIVTGPSQALTKIPWLRLVEIAPSRYLLAIPSGTPVESLELAILDVLENLPRTEHYERSLLSAVKEHVRSVRKQSKVCKVEILLVTA